MVTNLLQPVLQGNAVKGIEIHIFYIAVKAAGCKPSLNLLWAIEGALTDRDWKEISRDERTSLLIQLDDYERSEK